MAMAARGTIAGPSLTPFRRVWALGALPNPWLGRTITFHTGIAGGDIWAARVGRTITFYTAGGGVWAARIVHWNPSHGIITVDHLGGSPPSPAIAYRIR